MVKPHRCPQCGSLHTAPGERANEVLCKNLRCTLRVFNTSLSSEAILDIISFLNQLNEPGYLTHDE